MISVCMATYNGANFIKSQLESVLCQLNADDEVIISDDGSTDQTLRIIKEINDSRITLINHTPAVIEKHSLVNFRRATSNFENALVHSKGDIIFLCDQDDIWADGKVKTMSDELKKADLVQCNCSIIDDENKIIKHKFRDKCPFYSNVLSNLILMPFLGCCMAFKRQVLNWVLPFPNDLIAHDFWIGVITLSMGSALFIDEPLHLYRQHTSNVSPGAGKSKNTFYTKITYRLEIASQVWNRLKSLKEHHQ